MCVHQSSKVWQFECKGSPDSRTSLVVRWLRLCASATGGVGSIPGRGIKILHAVRCSKKLKLKSLKKRFSWACLVVQWLRLCTSIVGEWVLIPGGGTRRSNQSILKEVSPGISLEGMMLKLKLQYFGHLMGRAAEWRRP